MPPSPLQLGDADPAQDWAARCLSEISARSGEDSTARDRRGSPRKAASGSALIRPAFGAAIACTLVDWSEGGARLRVLSVLGIPDDFILCVGAERMRAHVAWRSPSELGVALSPESEDRSGD